MMKVFRTGRVESVYAVTIKLVSIFAIAYLLVLLTAKITNFLLFLMPLY